jgi:hypothetical protein
MRVARIIYVNFLESMCYVKRLRSVLISNSLGVQSVKRDTPHTIRIQWYKDIAAGQIILKEANLIMLATEHK